MTTKTTLERRPLSHAFCITRAQELIDMAREYLLDAFTQSSKPADLLRLIEDLALVQERLSTIDE